MGLKGTEVMGSISYTLVTNGPGIFWALIFYHAKHLEHKKSTRWGQGAKWDQVAWAPSHVMPPRLVWALDLRCRSSLSHDAKHDLKRLYKDSPWTIMKGGGRETWNTETEAVLARIGWGNAAGVTPECFSTLSDVNTIITAMKREYSTSGLWVCGSNLFYLSLMLQCLDTIWASQHDYGAYYVIPMWWIFILLDDQWDMICYYVLDVWVDAYYYPVLYYLFWSNMYARAREGDGVY
jgi:hypothetical protein